MSTTTMAILGVVLLGLGIVIINHAVQMKKNHKVAELFVNAEELKKCKDMASFADELYRPTLIFGIISVAFGIEEFVSMFITFPAIESAIVVGIYLVAWFWFSRELRNKKDKYCTKF